MTSGRSARSVGALAQQGCIAGFRRRPAAPVLLRQPVPTPLLGKTVLVQLPDPADASIARWLLKRMAALEAPEAGGICVHLASTAPGVATIVLRAGDESELQFVGELVEVVSVDAQ